MIGQVTNIAVQAELNEITKLILLDKTVGEPLPQPKEFSEYLRKNMTASSSKANARPDLALDQFGTPYVVSYPPDRVRVTSAGADLTFDTSDDIYSERVF